MGPQSHPQLQASPGCCDPFPGGPTLGFCSLPPALSCVSLKDFSDLFVTPFHTLSPRHSVLSANPDSVGIVIGITDMDVLQAFIVHVTGKLLWCKSSFWAQLTSICTLHPHKHLPYTDSIIKYLDRKSVV